MIIGIAAVNHWGVIGKDGGIPWRYRDDFKHFKNTTVGNVCLMGRKTFESIPKQLPNRKSWVISRNETPGDDSFTSVELAFQAYEKLPNPSRYPEDKPDLFICGGAQIYAACMDSIDRWIVTEIPDWIPMDPSVILMPMNYLKGFEVTQIEALECGLKVKTYERETERNSQST